MALYQLAYNATTHVATVQTSGSSVPSGSTLVGTTFNHGAEDGTDKDGSQVSHVIYTHVARILNKYIGEQNMQRVSIVYG